MAKASRARQLGIPVKSVVEAEEQPQQSAGAVDVDRRHSGALALHHLYHHHLQLRIPPSWSASSAHIPITRLQLPALSGMAAEPQTASSASGRGVLNISDLPTEFVISTLSQVLMFAGSLADGGLVCCAWYAVMKHLSAFWANVVFHKWCFPSLAVISSDALCPYFLESYASVLEGSLTYYLAVSLDISQFLEFNMAGASKSTLDARPHSERLVSLVIAFAGDLQQSYDFLSLNLCALSGDIFFRTSRTLSWPWYYRFPSRRTSSIRSSPRLLTAPQAPDFACHWLARPSLNHVPIVRSTPQQVSSTGLAHHAAHGSRDFRGIDNPLPCVR